jgi:hypothetical protein
VDERIDASAIALRLKRPYKCRRMRPHRHEQRLNRVEDARLAAERKGGRTETDDLAIVRRGEPPDDVHRIGGRVGVIERPVELVQRRSENADPRARIPDPALIWGTA